MRLLLLLSSLLSFSIMNAQLPASIRSAIDRVEPKCIEWRHQLHQFPELGNREFKTARMVADHLRSLGLEVQDSVAYTGVVGILKGAKPGPCIALRADMDGLPITETGELPWVSKEKAVYEGQQVGVMHACGHDTHVAMLMSVAEVMAGYRSQLKGTIKFVFQPAEEGPPSGEEGGASLMVKEGVMENPKVDAVFGLHINSATPVGTLAYKSGSFMASSDWFSIRIKGKGSHGSQPWLGVDPIAAAAQIIEGLQHIVSRQMDLTKAPVVITVGKINGGVRNNIIPDECVIDGTIRTLDSKMQKEVHDRIRHTATTIAEAAGATAEVSIDTKTLVTYNDPDLLNRMLPAFRRTLGDENVKERTWVTGAEDFSYFGTRAPALYLYLGGMKKDLDPAKAPPHHTPIFKVEDEAMKTGILSFCTFISEYLQLK
ncbi:MAG: amidohydrolase [Chitinophagaceae bacterium]